MCGLAGFTSPSQNDDLILKKMISSLTYRGPDFQNFHINKKIAMGHSRLMILDPNGGHQPCVDEKSGNIMAYNGEIYNFNEISKYLFKRNIQVNVNSDTDVLFSLLNNFGVDKAVEIIDGMFAIAYF
ncbi:asparagine synthetase B, partial [Alphaproteobacteria bacterium]|nr:asparagine synthetase B [Alphaproteobacteria bacterium]